MNATADERRTPYDASHVAIVDMGHTVWALYIPDPDQARTPRHVADNICDRKFADVEIVAVASRHYKSEGAAFSGWIVEAGHNFSEPIPNKREAMKALRHDIRAYFDHH